MRYAMRTPTAVLSRPRQPSFRRALAPRAADAALRRPAGPCSPCTLQASGRGCRGVHADDLPHHTPAARHNTFVRNGIWPQRAAAFHTTARNVMTTRGSAALTRTTSGARGRGALGPPLLSPSRTRVQSTPHPCEPRGRPDRGGGASARASEPDRCGLCVGAALLAIDDRRPDGERMARVDAHTEQDRLRAYRSLPPSRLAGEHAAPLAAA